MCLNCGCGQPDERHGNEANIVADDIRRAAKANGQSVAETTENMRQAMAGMASGGREAKEMAGASLRDDRPR